MRSATPWSRWGNAVVTAIRLEVSVAVRCTVVNVKRPTQTYQSYLLRLWWHEGERPHHASLQSTTDHTVQHFTSLEALLAHLLAHTAASPTPTQTPTPTPTRSEDQDKDD